MNIHSLTHELSSHLLFRERLRETFPDADDECLQDTLEGMTNLSEMLAEVLRSLLADEDFVGALKGRIGEMQARSTRLAERARKKRDLVSQVMADAEIKKLVEPDFTVSLRALRAPLVVVDEDQVPEAFWKVSDEWTVPLCATHHRALHDVGDEKAWWAKRGQDPLKHAEKSPVSAGLFTSTAS